MSVKIRDPDKEGPIEDPLPQPIHDKLRQRHEELEAFQEPVIADEHWKCSAINETLRAMRLVTDLEISVHRGVKDGVPALAAQVPSQDDDYLPLLRMSHWAHYRKYFAETFFYKAFVQRTRTLDWFWGMYGCFRDHGLVQGLRYILATLNGFVEQNETAISVTFINAHLVQVCERRYEMFDCFDDPTSVDFFHNV